MQLIKNMKITKKIVLSFSILIILTLINAAISIWSLNDIKTLDDEYYVLQNMEQNLSSFEESFYKERGSLLAFLITGNRDNLTKYEKQTIETKEAIKSLKEYSNYPELINYVSNIEELYNNISDKYYKEQISLMRNNLTVNEARVIEVSGKPIEIVNKISEEMSELIKLADYKFEKAKDSKNNNMSNVTTITLVSISLLIIISTLFAFLLYKVISKPIVNITNQMDTIANGNYSIDIDNISNKDEIGDMARAVEIFKKNGIERNKMLEKEKEEQKIKEERTKKLEKFMEDFDKDIGNILNDISISITEVENASTNMSQNAVETGDRIVDVTNNVNESNSNIQTVSSATTELSSSIDEITKQVSMTTNVSRDAVEKVVYTNDKVQKLSAASISIGEVINLINDIASQTNLLALNATIEAARAGEAGKGFAVVANEVKNLANQTTKATEEIANQIKNIQLETDGAVNAVNEIEQIIGKIDELTASVAAAVEEQSAATSEIARNVEQSASNSNAVLENVYTVKDAAENTGLLAENQKELVFKLIEKRNNLQNTINKFLENVKNI